jgi:GntR family transcriptional regulator
MDIVLSNSTDVPLYQQIYEQVRGEIIKGRLASGMTLPPIRTIAKELRVSVITVKKAWEELERGGYIFSQAGRGCFVAPLPEPSLLSKRNDLVRDKLLRDIAYYRSVGLSRSELQTLIGILYPDEGAGTRQD